MSLLMEDYNTAYESFFYFSKNLNKHNNNNKMESRQASLS
jgi:hypothetical protein